MIEPPTDGSVMPQEPFATIPSQTRDVLRRSKNFQLSRSTQLLYNVILERTQEKEQHTIERYYQLCFITITTRSVWAFGWRIS